MKPFFILLSLLLSHNLYAAEQLSMTSDQQVKLGIEVANLKGSHSVWGTPYPAEVVVPNAQLRVVSARQGGLLETLLVAEGEEVIKGQELAIIQSPQLLQQQRDYLEALIRMELANADLKRDQQLKKEGLIAQRRYLETHSRSVLANTDTQQRRQALALAGMDKVSMEILSTQRQLSGVLKILSPLDGVVLEQMATPGQRLEAADPIYMVGKLSPLWLEVHVPLEHLIGINHETRIKVANSHIIGQVITIGRMVHGTDQGVLVRAELNQRVETLRPGQFVQAHIQSTSTQKIFRIPRSALIRHKNKNWIFVKNEQGFAVQEVNIAKEGDDFIVISGKLSLKMSLAVSGTSSLKAIWLGGEE
jgi:RND family efflux transporter MFP subunit